MAELRLHHKSSEMQFYVCDAQQDQNTGEEPRNPCALLDMVMSVSIATWRKRHRKPDLSISIYPAMSVWCGGDYPEGRWRRNESRQRWLDKWWLFPFNTKKNGAWRRRWGKLRGEFPGKQKPDLISHSIPADRVDQRTGRLGVHYHYRGVFSTRKEWFSFSNTWISSLNPTICALRGKGGDKKIRKTWRWLTHRPKVP